MVVAVTYFLQQLAVFLLPIIKAQCTTAVLLQQGAVYADRRKMGRSVLLLLSIFSDISIPLHFMSIRQQVFPPVVIPTVKSEKKLPKNPKFPIAK